MAITSTTGSLATSGLGSGLDVNGLVSKLMAVESQPLTALATKEAAYQAKISAYGTLKGALSALQTSLSGLLDTGSMKSIAATLGDSTLATVVAGASAVPGTYSIKVSSLAYAHKIASNGFATTNDTVGSGSLTFSFGTWDGAAFTANPDSAARTVTIGAGQSTLAGIRDAVNSAGIGVTATIVNDGQAAGNRLVFTSAATGAANSLKVSVADSDTTNTDTAGLSVLAYDPAALAGAGRNMTQKVEAKNAQLVIDGIDVSKASNSISDAIQGVTLNLLKANPDASTTLTVSADPSSISKSVQGFVKAYNDLMASIDSLTKYDSIAKKGAVLSGDGAPRSAQAQVRAVVGSILGGGGLTLTSLSQIGVSFKLDGTLSLDSGKLSSAVSSDATGVRRLFAAVGVATDSLVTVSGTGTKTVPGTYALDITQLATQGRAAGSAVSALTITSGMNDTLAVTVNGVAAGVTLAPGTYATAAALASEIQSKINGASALSAAGAKVTVTEAGGVLTVTSAKYGSASNVAIAGNAVTDLFGTPTSTAGVDVAGTIGGLAATGNGQTLTSTTGDPSGIAIAVTGGGTGARGSITFTQGIAHRLSQTLTSLLATDGAVAASTDGVNKRIADIAKRREQMQAHLDKTQATYLAKFRALDTMLASMNATSSYLTQQLDALASLRDQIASNK